MICCTPNTSGFDGLAEVRWCSLLCGPLPCRDRWELYHSGRRLHEAPLCPLPSPTHSDRGVLWCGRRVSARARVFYVLGPARARDLLTCPLDITSTVWFVSLLFLFCYVSLVCLLVLFCCFCCWFCFLPVVFAVVLFRVVWLSVVIFLACLLACLLTCLLACLSLLLLLLFCCLFFLDGVVYLRLPATSHHLVRVVQASGGRVHHIRAIRAQQS